MLEVKCPPEIVFRIGRKPDPWAPPSWAYAHEDGTFGNRFDDPEGSYRVLYASSQRVSCFAETLARFRPSLEVLAELDLIDGADNFASFNPADWIANRRIGTATVRGVFADIYANAWVSLLRRELAGLALELGIHEIDASALQANGPRRLTQAASLRVRLRGLNGVYYRSRFGHSMENCALFEPWDFDAHESEEIALDDADMWTILERFAIATQGR
jgi:hypothetical protein